MGIFKIIAFILSLKSADKLTLASLITSECSICSEEEMYLVGSTVLNRRDNIKFPPTIGGVIVSPRQFSGFNSKWFYPTRETLRVADNLLKGVGRNCEVLYFCQKDIPYAKTIESDMLFELEHHIYSR